MKISDEIVGADLKEREKKREGRKREKEEEIDI